MLILYGGGKPPDILDKSIIKAAGFKGRILFIPNAATKNYEDCFVFFENYMKSFGFSKTVLWDIEQDDENSIGLNPEDVIYIGAGNTFKLLEILKKKNLFDFLKNEYTKGRTMAGYSAGAIIMGKDIEPCGDEKINNFSSTVGLGFFPFSIRPHYQNSIKEIKYLKKFCKDNQQEAIALPDGTGIIYDDKIEFIGQGIVKFDTKGNY